MENREIFDKMGIILILVLYIFSAIGKIFNFKGTVDMLYSRIIFKSLPRFFSVISIVIVILLLGVGSPTLILCSFKKEKKLFRDIGKYLNLAFIIFTTLATILFHFPDSKSQQIHFLKNMGILGGFTMSLGSFIR